MVRIEHVKRGTGDRILYQQAWEAKNKAFEEGRFEISTDLQGILCDLLSRKPGYAGGVFCGFRSTHNCLSYNFRSGRAYDVYVR